MKKREKTASKYEEDGEDSTSKHEGVIEEAASARVEEEPEATSARVEDDQGAASARVEDDQEAASARVEDDQEAASARVEDDQEAASARGEDEQEAASARGEDEQEAASARGEDEQRAGSKLGDGDGSLVEHEAEEMEDEKDGAPGGRTKSYIPGIIYLGHIPPRLRPRHIRNMLSVHGEVGRIFLQAEDRFVRKKKKKAGSNARDFTEGWVEFRDKRVAKLVAASLNSSPMGTRKKNRFHDDLWNMKYLHRFKWSHLSERLAIERQVRQQRMRAEVSQAKRETNFYLQNVERSKQFSKADRRRATEPEKEGSGNKQWNFTQRKTEEEIQSLKAGGSSGDQQRIQKRIKQAKQAQEKSQTSRSLLHKIFNTAGTQG